VRLVPVGKLTFPDQQQDLQNAAEQSLTKKYNGGVNFPRLAEDADFAPNWLPHGVRVG
jgi:hypothetical protein